MDLNLKQSWAVILGAIVVTTGFYGVSHFSKYKSDIVIQLADFMEVVALPYRIAHLSTLTPDETIEMPVYGVNIREIEDSFGDPRSGGRSHRGIDIFAKRGTPVYAATKGFVLRVGESELGGNYVWTVGPGGRRYYYAHLNSFAEEIKFGNPVTTDTVIGYVGNTGNASTTPPHLHFEMRIPGEGATNPFGILVNRG